MALAKTLESIEATSSRLKNMEILANYFRSVILLSPEDFLLSVYLCLNKLAPAYEGKFGFNTQFSTFKFKIQEQFQLIILIF